MADNVFDVYDAPTNVASGNVFDKFHTDTPHDFSNVTSAASTTAAQPAPGLGELATRGLVQGGAALLRTFQGLANSANPGMSISNQVVESQLPPAARAAFHGDTHLLNSFADRADEYAAPAPGEDTPGLGGRVVQGASRLLPEVAGVIASGGESAVPEAVTAAARAVPYVGRVLGGIAEGLPTAAKFTGVETANLPDSMSPGEKAAATAKAFATNAALAGLPAALGASPLVRVPTGAALGYGESAAMSALSGEQQDQAQNIVGGLQGAAFGLAPHGAPAQPEAAPSSRPVPTPDAIAPEVARPTSPAVEQAPAPIQSGQIVSHAPADAAADNIAATVPRETERPTPQLESDIPPRPQSPIGANERDDAPLAQPLSAVAPAAETRAAARYPDADPGSLADAANAIAPRIGANPFDAFHEDEPPAAVQNVFDQFHPPAESNGFEGRADALEKHDKTDATKAPLDLPDDDTLAAWSALARDADAFRYAKPGNRDLVENFAEAAPSYKVAEAPELAAQNEDGAQQAWRITAPDGTPAGVYRDGKDVWVDVSDLDPRSGGQSIYSAVADWAHANDYRFVGDPAGLSNVALKRRPEAMLSSALAHGTTDHLAPHPRQLEGDARLGVPGLDWRPGDTTHNVQELTRVTRAVTEHEFPEIRDIHYNPDTRRFERNDGTKVTHADFDQLARDKRIQAEAGLARALRVPVDRLTESQRSRVRDAYTAGGSTLARHALGNTVLRGKGEALRRLLLDRSRDADAQPLAGQSLQDLNLARILYSAPRAPEVESPGPGMRRDALQRTVDRVTSRWSGDAPRVEVHQSHDDLSVPTGLRRAPDFHRGVDGAYDPNTGTVHLFADAMRSPRRAVEVLAHEALGHHGLERALGGEFGQLTGDIAKLRANRPDYLKDAFAEIDRRHPNADDATFAREALALMVERGVRNGVVDRAVGAVKRFLRAIGIDAPFTEREYRQMLLGVARRHVETTSASGSGDRSEIDRAARAAATHPQAAEPATVAQQQAGNHRMAHVDVHGLDVTIEVPKGGMRRGLDRNGNAWERQVSDHYGYIKRSEGADGEQFDVYLGPRAADPDAKVFVIDQHKPGTSQFDEHKAMIGYRNAGDARRSYEANFPKGLKTFGGITEMSADQFKEWVRNGDTTKPLAGSAEAIPLASDLPPRAPGEPRDNFLRRVVRSPDVRDATSLRSQQKTIGRHAIREMLAKRQRSMDTADAVFKEYRNQLDRVEPARNFANVDAWETGKPIADPTFRSFVGQMKAGFDERIDRLHELDPNALQNLIAHYFPHLYKDPARAAAVLHGIAERRSLAGDTSFLKPRAWPTLREAMAAGLEPVTTNPVDWALLKYASMDKYIGMLELKQELDARGWLPKLSSTQPPPFGFKRVSDPAFNGHALPVTIARDITNYLDPGFSKYAPWRTLRGIQNFMVAADLGFSGFHGTFTSTDNVIMHLDVAARRAAIGDSRGAAATLVKALTSIATSPFEGHKLNQQWRGLREADANTAAVLDALERGGARWKMSTTEYQNAIPKVARWWRQITGTGLASKVRGATPAQIAVGAVKVPATGLQAAAELGSYLIHHVLVPNQKMAARVLLYKYELDRRAQDLGRQRGDYAGIVDAMHPDVVRQLAAQVNDVVDYRLGQMAYDNRFWNRTAQDLAQATVMAPGWQYGMLQTVLGAGKAVKDLVRPTQFVAPLDREGTITNAHMGRVGSNLSYFATLALTLGGGMATLQYLLTGKGPDSLKDYFFPKTGRKNDDDSDERLQLPNYWVDHYKLTTDPARTAENKIHPLWKMIWEIAHNKDYFGTQIRRPEAPALEQAKEIGAYVASKFVPITMSNMQRGTARAEGTAQQVGHFFGVNQAPAGVARTAFQNFVAQGGSRGWGSYTKTQEDAEHRQAVRAASAAIRRGETPSTDNMAPADLVKARQDARTSVPAAMFKRLADTDKLRAYELATPNERERYGLRAAIGRMNLERSAPFKRMAPAEQAQLRARLQAIRQGPP